MEDPFLLVSLRAGLYVYLVCNGTPTLTFTYMYTCRISPFRSPHVFTAGLSFLLSIACVAETLPVVNNFIQLAPFPTKSSKVALLRLLLFNFSSCYFIEYFSTFIFRRDIWMERNKSYHVSTMGTLAADEEKRLLLEERKQNSILVYFLCLVTINLIVRIF